MTTSKSPDELNGSAKPAADLIRQKLNQLYNSEPNAREELIETNSATHRSIHQKFMYDLGRSGKSLAEIQTAWHSYYQQLPDDQKHQVWDEFYREYNQQGNRTNRPAEASHPAALNHQPAQSVPAKELRTTIEIKNQILKHIKAQANTKRGGHLKSMLFGLSCGLVVVVFLLFGLFNERFLAPFITPSKTVSSTSIIIDPSGSAVGPEPKIIIPKINVEIPVVYTEPSVEEHAVQKALEKGVLHYATTSKPGEQGNGTIFGHSSNNILNKGNYKFAFVLLKRLEVGDTFILQKDSERYVYKVFSKKVVKPTDVAVLNDTQGKPATFSLITCDPPGTSLNRLVVTGEQITPDPSGNVASTAKPADTQTTILPSNSPTIWSRLYNWLSN